MMFNNMDCLSVIANKLCYIDQLSLKLTCKNKMPLNFKSILIKRLLEHRIVPTIAFAKLFCENLYATGAYVAGSFILDCLYDTNHHNDIDIYDQTSLIPFYTHTDKDGNQSIYNGIDDLYGFGTSDMNNLKFTQTLYTMGFFSKHDTCGPNPLLRNYFHSEFYNKDDLTAVCHPQARHRENNIYNMKDKIQIIPIGLTPKKERSFIPRFISASFDLEICQNIFDGHHLYIKNVNKLLEKYDYIKPNTRFMLNVYPEQTDSINLVTDKRMEKYIKKGFKIERHPKFDEINQHIKEIIDSKKYFGNDHYLINYIDDGSINLSHY